MKGRFVSLESGDSGVKIIVDEDFFQTSSGGSLPLHGEMWSDIEDQGFGCMNDRTAQEK